MRDLLDRRFSDYWTSIAGRYDRKMGHGWINELQHLAWMHAIGQFLPSEPAMILDVGCGTGFLSRLCLEAGHRVVSLDYSTGMLSEAQLRLINPRICLADAQTLPFSAMQFDMVICRFLLWTLRSPSDVFMEWRRVLRPGGQILAVETCWWDHSFSRVVKNWLALLLTNWHDWRFPKRMIPAMEDVYHEGIMRHLPFQHRASRHYIEQLLSESGFGNISFQHLKTIERLEKQGLHIRRQMEYHSRYLIHAYRIEE